MTKGWRSRTAPLRTEPQQLYSAVSNRKGRFGGLLYFGPYLGVTSCIKSYLCLPMTRVVQACREKSMFRHLKLTPKIAGAIAITLTLTSIVAFFVTQHRINRQGEDAFLDKLRKTDGMASSVRVFFSANVEEYVPNHRFRHLKQVPVAVSWSITREYAESQGMKFSTPSLQPRNPAHTADAFEAAALKAFSQNPNLSEYYSRTVLEGQPVMRYAQPVRLTQDCLVCHGAPIGQKDPFGYVKEGMKAGDLRGAFVVTAPTNGLNEMSRANSWALFLLNLGMLLAAVAVIAWVVRRFVVKPVAASAELAKQIASKNLAVDDIELDSMDEVGEAVAALNSMKNNLHSMVEGIAATAEHLASASQQISASANLQVSAAQSQNDRATQVATSMQEMASTVGQISDNTQGAAKGANQATQQAQAGGKIVEEAVLSMRSIADSARATAAKVTELGKNSSQIGEIVNVIEEIADQTNLLALNAAIEAARAGEQGRGFAVVADEVRKLAERTSKATQEIASRIRNTQSETDLVVKAMDGSTKQVEEGVTATGQAGDALAQIVSMNNQLQDMINQIATATAQQTAATEETRSNISEIARLAGESSHGAAESAKACEQLSELALDLEKMVGQFSLKSQAGERSFSYRALRNGDSACSVKENKQARGAAAGAD